MSTSKEPASVDVLLICALKDEYDQVIKVVDGLLTQDWQEYPNQKGWTVADAQFETPSGQPLSIRATWAAHMGGEQIQAAASNLIRDYPARCIAMSGICAGRRDKVSLGDVVFAERLWSYDAGKICVENGSTVFQGDQLQYRPPDLWVHRMQKFVVPSNAQWLSLRPHLPLEHQEDWVLFQLQANIDPINSPSFETCCPDWPVVLQRLWDRNWVERPIKLTDLGSTRVQNLSLLYPKKLPSPLPFRIHVAPMATGAAVVEDIGIFHRLSSSMRKVLAIDMEASALGALGEAHNVPIIIAKGVSDYGDPFKDDRYRHFSARAAAECLISVLRNSRDLLYEPNPSRNSVEENSLQGATPLSVLSRLESPHPRSTRPLSPLYKWSPRLQSYRQVFPGDKTSSEAIYISPKYRFERYVIPEKQEELDDSSDFISDAKTYLLSPPNLLVIAGPYGSGKSFLAKHIDLIGLLGPKEKMVHIGARLLARFILKHPQSSQWPVKSDGLTGVIIDGLDELIVDEPKGNDEIGNVMQFVAHLSAENIPVVITLRISDTAQSEKIIDRLLTAALDHDLVDVPMIRLKGFDRERTINWLKNYYQGFSDASPLEVSTLNRLHKKLIAATSTPLFLYMLAFTYYRLGISSIEDVYSIYDTFVSSTTSGRFRSGQTQGTNGWAFSSLYEDVLENIASAINNSNDARQVPLGELNDSEWNLDPNTKIYAIPESDAVAVLSKDANQLIKQTLTQHFSVEDIQLQFLNNYFFASGQGRIGFRDNNILFFLVARRLNHALDMILSDSVEEQSHALAVIAETKGHPIALEILLNRLDQDAAERNKAISQRIQQLISIGKIIQITPDSLDSLSAKSINRDIILSIVLLHVKQSGYSGLQYFVTRLAWLTSAAKVSDGLYRQLINRFFRRITLNDIEFRRINCDGYNFSSSILRNAQFIQCKLFYARFSNAEFEDVQFRFCDFGNSDIQTNFDGAKGNISISYSSGGELRIAGICAPLQIEISRSTFKSIRLEAVNLSSSCRIDLVIDGSEIQNLVLKNAYLHNARICGSHIFTVSDKNSHGKIVFDSVLFRNTVEMKKTTGNIQLEVQSTYA